MMTIYTTLVGSTVFGANGPDSDVDIATCYIANTKDVILGKCVKSKKQRILGRADINSVEIGHLVGMLKSGSVIDLMSVHSPIVIGTSRWHERLKHATCMRANPNFYWAMLGEANGYLKSASYKKPAFAKIIRKIWFVCSYIDAMWDPPKPLSASCYTVPDDLGVENTRESLLTMRDYLIDKSKDSSWIHGVDTSKRYTDMFCSCLDEYLLSVRDEKWRVDSLIE